MAEIWLKTNHHRDVLHSLRHAWDCKCASDERPEMWKWTIIAMHNAVHGAMVCHLSGSQEIGALKADLSLRWLAFNQHDRSPEMVEPKKELASINALFQRTTTGQQTDRSGKPVDWANDSLQRPIEVTEETRMAFKRLVSFRNDFVHFSPRAWFIELSGMPKVFEHIAEFVSRIASVGWAFRHLSGEEKEEFDRLLDRLAR